MDAKRFWVVIGGRKFLGFVLASVFLYLGKISQDIWLIAFSVYCGSNIAQKIFYEKEDKAK